MNNSPAPIIGIDLGTTFSVVAHLDASGRPTTLLNAEGEKLTPSFVLFENDSIIVGKEAVKAMSTNMDSIAECPKRDLGKRFFHKPIDGRHYPPESLEAMILNKLRQDAQRTAGNFEKVVVTVPAYFDEVRRKATQDAGFMAGLDVIDIINEPTAAAVSYGYEKGLLSASGESVAPMKFLVYDLGGGTFDTTVMEIAGANFRVMATDGDMQLGGRDWDQRLVDHVAAEFQRMYGLDPRLDANSAGRLWRECEDAKRTLSTREKATVSFDFQGQAARIEVARATFENMTGDLLERTAFTTRQVLQAAGLEWNAIDCVLMVGGSTRMPAVAAMLQRLSGKQPDHSHAPDEAIAHGAALRAGFLLRQQTESPVSFRIRNVNSHSLGVVAGDPQTGRKRNAILVPRNTPLPVVAKRTFQTQKPGQKSIRVEIIEGESSSPDECIQIGKCSVRNLPPDLPVGTPIEVKFRYEENGRLHVDVKVQNTDANLNHEIIRENSLSQEQLISWRNFICGLAG